MPGTRRDEQRASVARIEPRMVNEIAEEVRTIRALELLEQLGTPEARTLLQTLAKGAPNADLTREAKAILDRLERRRAE